MTGVLISVSRYLLRYASESLFVIHFRWILIGVLSMLATIWYLKHRKFVQQIDRLPGPKANFFLGNILHLGFLKLAGGRTIALKHMLQALTGCEMLYRKGITRFWLLNSPLIILSDANAIETVVSSQTLTSKSRFYKFLEVGVGTGLTTSSGDKHKTRRKMINPAFHFRILEQFFPIFNKNSKIAVSKIGENIHKDHFDMQRIVIMYTLDSICETMMGVSINAQLQEKEDSDYVKAIQVLAILAVEQILRPWLWSDFLFRRSAKGREAYKHLDIFHSFSKEVIQRRLEQMKKSQDINCNKESESQVKKRVLLMDLLLNEHLKDKNFTLQDVSEEVDTFMVAGHDTAATGMTWTLFLIGHHPEVQEKIHAEIDEIFDNDLEREITPEDLKQLKYLDCVLKEGMRIYPPAGIIGREITEETVINGYTIPKNADCWLFIYGLHRDPVYFPEPEKFDPDRFLPENSKGRHLFAYLPFSAGPRNCIGQKFAMDQVKVLMADIFRHFTIESLQPRDKIQPSLLAILHPPGPINMRCTRRRRD